MSKPHKRHGAPSGPWPFVDLDDEVDPARLDDPFSHLPMSAAACDHKQLPEQEFCWCKYPQSLYPNWTKRQQKKANILKIIELKLASCMVYYLDVKADGIFVGAGTREFSNSSLNAQWAAMQKGRPKDVRLRMLFVDNCSGPVLQMIGTRYNIEPFYFSSTNGWTPCRFQSNVIKNTSDHITVVLTFIRSVHGSMFPPGSVSSYEESIHTIHTARPRSTRPHFTIDTQAPLFLNSNNTLLQLDRLALHMVRDRTSSTIISLHPSPDHHATSAEKLHTRVHLTGKSVYWCNIFKDTSDPTFVFLSYLWYAIYAWDEAFERLYSHVCHLEADALQTDKQETTQELHVIRARLQSFKELLADFKKSIEFLAQTPNPALQAPDDENDQTDFEIRQKHSEMLMAREVKILLIEIERLVRTRGMMEMRLKNVMALTYGRIVIDDNKQMRLLTEASMMDNAAMKLLTFLTMFFFPALFIANVFSMNIAEINPQGAGTLNQFLIATFSLTVVTVYVIVAYQLEIRVPRAIVEDEDDTSPFGHRRPTKPREREEDLLKLSAWDRVFWPVVLTRTFLAKWGRKRKRKSAIGLRYE